MKINLNKLESRLQELVEVHLANYLPGNKKESLVAQQLAAAMQSNLMEEDGEKLAPNVYTLVAHPDLVQKWQADKKMIEAFKQVLDTAADEAELKFAAPPTITLAPDDALASDEVHIVASHRVEAIEETQGMPSDADDDEDALADNLPANAFLIVHGTKVFPLQESVVNIGRRIENQLTIDDPRVSRNHAQLRAIKGRFVIFDLDSTGGTFVNGQRTNQTVLYPGDVISLAGVPLIFGQDNPPSQLDLSNTAPIPASSTERPTAVLRDTVEFEKKKKK